MNYKDTCWTASFKLQVAHHVPDILKLGFSRNPECRPSFLCPVEQMFVVRTTEVFFDMGGSIKAEENNF